MNNYFFKLAVDDACFYKQKKILRDSVKQIVIKALKRDFPHYKIKEVKLRKVQINPEDFAGEAEKIKHVCYVSEKITAFLFDLAIDNKIYDGVYVPFSGFMDLFARNVVVSEDVILRESVAYKPQKSDDEPVQMTVFWDSLHVF